MTQRQQGWVRWFDTAQGLGFIKRAAGQADVFVHFSAIRGRYFHNLDEGQQVEFEVVASERGPLADDVVVLAESSQPSATHSDSWAFGHRPVDLDTLPAMLEAHRLFVDSREEAGQQLDLWGADLRGARLRGADLRRAALEGADLEGADLRGADLGRAFVFRAHFGGADLSRASLRRALACEASFVGAKLEKVDLRRANLYGASFEQAQMGRAEFEDAELVNAQLTQAVDLSSLGLAKARTLHGAQLAAQVQQGVARVNPALFDRPQQEDG